MPGLLTTWSGWLMRQEVQVSSRLAIKPPDGQLAIRPDESNRGEKFHKVQQVCYGKWGRTRFRIIARIQILQLYQKLVGTVLQP